MVAVWTKPAFTHGTVNKAGEILRHPRITVDQLEWALGVLNNWRSSHSFPLNTFQVNLRRTASKFDSAALVAQRLKRASSVVLKLQRYKTMQLVQMQDVGGCRVVLNTVQEARLVHKQYLGGGMKHQLVNAKDYIEKPKDTGYRGIHLVYRYNSDRSETYNGLLIEMQIRSRLQHAWATAVETVDTFLQFALKSSEGPAPWLSFFTHMGSVFAQIEGTPQAPGTPSDPKELRQAVRDMANSLHVIERLEAYGFALSLVLEKENPKAHFYLLRLEPTNRKLDVTTYTRGQLEQATVDYLKAEKDVAQSGIAEVVLVAADNLAALRLAYPNYFLDTTEFLARLSSYLEG